LTDSRRRRVLGRFFARHVLPRARDPRVEAERAAERSRSDSYFRPCESRAPGFALAFADPAEIEASLARRWRGGPLDGLARPLVKLALRFRDVREKDEVSSFVYEMF
jgi:hypothetical protein